MSMFPEPPFTEHEERYFLAEILKRSPLPTNTLLKLIRDANIEPAWTEIALPNGRSVNSCQNAFNALIARSQPPPMAAPMFPPTEKRRKRTFQGAEAGPSSTTREIQPRPPAFSSVNGSQTMIAPTPIAMSPVEPPRKKRGRPTKIEFERRQAEARERGEIWPKPRKPKTPRTSMEGVEATGGAGSARGTPTSVTMEVTPEGSQRTPSMAGPGSGQAPTALMDAAGTSGMAITPSPSGKKQKQRADPSMPPPGAQVQHEEMRAARGGAPTEATMSEFQASQNLLAGFRQHGQIASSPHLAPAGSPSQMQSPYGPTSGPFPGFQMEERPPEQPPR